MATILWLPIAFLAQAVVILYPGVFVFWLIMHTQIDRLRPFGIRAYWVAAFAWLVTAGPLFAARKSIFSVRWPPPGGLAGILLAAGIASIAASIIVLWQASRQISMRIMVGLPEVEPQRNSRRILNAGIYARTRNPLYLGHWLLVFAAAALSNYAANWIGVALDCVALPLLIRVEERELLARYDGEFAEYMERVPRLFPSIAPLSRRGLR